MTIIYSNKKIEGLVGVYSNPCYFAEIDKKATVVMTDNESIKSAYESAGIEVKALGADDEAKVTGESAEVKQKRGRRK